MKTALNKSVLSRRKRLGAYVLKMLFSGLALYFVFRNVDLHELKRNLYSVRIQWFLAGFGLYVLSQLVSVMRLDRLLVSERIHLPFWFNLRMYFVGMAYNLFLPGGVGGDAYKSVVFVRRSGAKIGPVVRALVYDRLSGLLAIGIFAVLLASIIPLKGFWPYRMWYYLLAPLAILASMLLLRFTSRQYLRHFHEIVLLALVLQGLQMLCVSVLFHSIPDTEMGPILILKLNLIFLVSSVATVIPVFLGGIGAREAVFGSMAVWMGLDADLMVQTALLFSTVTILASLPGLPLDWVRRRSERKVEEMDQDRDAVAAS